MTTARVFRVERRAMFVLAASLLLSSCAEQGPQTLIVSDDGYELDGMRSSTLASFAHTFRPADPIAVQACECADADRVTAAIDWLRAQDVAEIAFSTLPSDDPQCGFCR